MVSRIQTVTLAMQVAGPFFASADKHLDFEPPGAAVTNTKDDLLSERP